MTVLAPADFQAIRDALDAAQVYSLVRQAKQDALEQAHARAGDKRAIAQAQLDGRKDAAEKRYNDAVAAAEEKRAAHIKDAEQAFAEDTAVGETAIAAAKAELDQAESDLQIAQRGLKEKWNIDLEKPAVVVGGSVRL